MNWRSEPRSNLNSRRRKLREQLIEGALESISERGYAETSVSHIASHAQVGRTQFYFVFQDKEDCFLALQSRVFDEICARVEAAVDRSESWDAQVRAATDAILDAFDEEPSLARIALIESPLAGPHAQEQHRGAMSRLMETVQCDVPDKATSRGLPDSLGEMAIGSASAILARAVIDRDVPSFQCLAPEVYFALSLPFMGPEAASAKAQEAYADAHWAGQGPVGPRGRQDQSYS